MAIKKKKLRLFHFETNDYKAADYNWREDVERQNVSCISWSELTGVLRHSLKKWIDSQKEFQWCENLHCISSAHQKAIYLIVPKVQKQSGIFPACCLLRGMGNPRKNRNQKNPENLYCTPVHFQETYLFLINFFLKRNFPKHFRKKIQPSLLICSFGK